jgi:MFS family permease
VFAWSSGLTLGAAVALSLLFGVYARSAGRPMFAFLLLVMIVLATTELGVDSWITPLMEGEFKPMGINPVWVLIYTSFLMMVLRLFAGALVHRISPVGLLCVSSLLAAIGLWSLAGATGAMILLAATLYGVGKSFFWPTMLGIVAERFPRGGALTLNAMGGAGMLGVGVVGAVFLGYIQDTEALHQLQVKDPAVHQQVVSEKQWVLGSYQAIDPEKVKAIAEAPKQAEIAAVQEGAKKSALATAATFPVIMLVSFLGLALWFRSKGGYRAEQLGSH